MYSEDAYTLGKTSLVRTAHGFPSKYNLPFHQVEFSSIETVPLISFGDQQQPEATQESKDVNAPASPQVSQVARSEKSAAPYQQSERSHPAIASGSSSGSKGEALGSGSEQHVSVPSSQTSNQAPSSSKPSPIPLLSETSLPKSSVSHPAEPSTYEEIRASFQHDWERTSGENTYAPPPCTTPWGYEQDVGENIGDPFNPPPKEDHRITRKSYASAHQSEPLPRRTDRPVPTPFTNSRQSTLARRGPTSFKGGWDDLISGQVEPLPSMQVPTSPSVRSSGSGKLSELPIQGDVAINRHGDRVDLPLPPASVRDKQRLTARTKDRKLCNEHHLRRACHNDQCHYDHEPIDAGILLALRHLARTQACDVGSGCRMFECCYGHHCPYRDGGKECKVAKCSFKRMSLHHVRDLKVAEVIPAPRR